MNKQNWFDEDDVNPITDGLYLCLCRFVNSKEYDYKLVKFSVEHGWIIENNCKHIIWTCLIPKPENIIILK